MCELPRSFYNFPLASCFRRGIIGAYTLTSSHEQGENMKHAHWSTWYSGSKADWDSLSYDDHREVAFLHTGCEVAWPTWTAPVECVHAGCQVRRGEKPAIHLVNGSLRYEITTGWLRFVDRTDRDARESLAATLRGIRRVYFTTGETDIWKCWPAIVGLGVNGK